MRTITEYVVIGALLSIAVLSLATALANAASKAIEPTVNQQPSVMQEETAPIQPLYMTALPQAYVDDAR